MENIRLLNGRNVYDLIKQLQDKGRLIPIQRIELRKILSKNTVTSRDRIYVKNLYLQVFKPAKTIAVQKHKERIIAQHELANYQFGG